MLTTPAGKGQARVDTHQQAQGERDEGEQNGQVEIEYAIDEVEGGRLNAVQISAMRCEHVVEDDVQWSDHQFAVVDAVDQQQCRCDNSCINNAPFHQIADFSTAAGLHEEIH